MGSGVGSPSLGRAAKVSLLRWLRRQLREPDALREHLEAAIENDDSGEVRRIIVHYDFSSTQRRHVERLLDQWELDLRRQGDAERL